MIETFKVPLFEQERKIRVYLPNNYKETNKHYPVLFMHDGQNVFDNTEAIGGVSLDLHKYLDKNKVDIIVVAIDQNTIGEERINEYCPWENGEFSTKLLGYVSATGGKGKEYVDFIVHELKPLIDSKYRTKEAQTFMAGISLGGLISTYAACSYPNVFKRIAVISSAYYRNQEKMEELLKDSDVSTLERFYLDCGTMEAGENDEISDLFLLSNQLIYEIVKNKAIKTKFEIIEEANHNYNAFKERISKFIIFLTS
ncbi:esterase [Bacillus pseudomycoides]|uniref:alpha/beta hydrolase n=1 Tax=Bacillus pseudomycoides TaxID=64104 RepID=UPI000BFE00C2|nr:alpha/beta hydrolase-fold protein [Bacillus pseudomycoides]PHF35221.1 esterase [Bacillus pseudomycoides]